MMGVWEKEAGASWEDRVVGGGKEGRCWAGGRPGRSSRSHSQRPGKPAHFTEHAQHCSHMLSRPSQVSEAAWLALGGFPQKMQKRGDPSEQYQGKLKEHLQGSQKHVSSTPNHDFSPLYILASKKREVERNCF